MTLSIVAAMASNRVIGLHNALPWYLPADLAHFKKLTLGRFLIMGRKTYESLKGPLPERTIVVVTRQTNYQPASEEIHCAHSLQEALLLAQDQNEIFVAGGSEIYREALPITNRIYLTLIHAEFEGDTYFPDFEDKDWELVRRTDHAADDRNCWDYSFLIYHRVS